MAKILPQKNLKTHWCETQSRERISHCGFKYCKHPDKPKEIAYEGKPKVP
jgi:hypothetical protein